LYPPLLFWYVPASIALFVWPAAFVLAANADFPAFREWTAALIPTSTSMSTVVAGALALGTWWIVLGLLGRGFKQVVRAAVWPFAEGFDRRHAIGVMVAGGILFVTAVVVVVVL
ncbi:MAG: hypothetical protein ACRD15_18335, partial [Vicinamibacterales bacterium]